MNNAIIESAQGIQAVDLDGFCFRWGCMDRLDV